jgi:cytochrome c-type biogenesis protein CcmH
MKRFLVILLLVIGGSSALTGLFAVSPAMAVLPDEILDDPVLEARARVISKGLRCLVCRNENIDESNADLARDLRLLVRERLVDGDTNEEVFSFIVARYGEYVLLRPKINGVNWLLWASGPLFFLLAGTVGYMFVRGRARAVQQMAALSTTEQDRLREIMED